MTHKTADETLSQTPELSHSAESSAGFTPSVTLMPVSDHKPRRSGPRTPAGKAKVARNAITHGIFAKAYVLPGVERAEDWDAHLQGMLASFSPADHFGEVLVKLATAQAWRIERHRRWETAILIKRQAQVKEEIAQLLPLLAKQQGYVGWSDLDGLDEAIHLAQRRQALADQLGLRADTTPVPRESAHDLLYGMITDAGLQPREVPRHVQALLRSTDDPLPRAKVLATIKALASRAGKKVATLLRAAAEAGKEQERKLQETQAYVTMQGQLLEGLYLEPEAETLHQNTKTGTQLLRGLERIHSILEVRQARQRGEPVPTVLVEHSGLPEELTVG